MKDTVNFYFAMLLLFVAGVGTGLLIYHIATTDSFTTTFSGSESKYAPLQDSILNQ